MLLVVFYYLWVFDVQFVDVVGGQGVVVVVFYVGVGGWDWQVDGVVVFGQIQWIDVCCR